MGIKLFKHNADAYKKACKMLDDVGKTAVIHPTGTGKSFIGFKLAEDNRDKCVCWLSPSDYIFKTQIENIQRTEQVDLSNVKFFTYSRLMNMKEEEIGDIYPDYIVLDEFHRCGAEMWGKGVANLIARFPKAKLLGLSATNIRYLDNQRDMADELFDGNVASEISLGEAIVRGILSPPKYVLSVFSYQKELERYEKRIKATKNSVAREKASEYLESLRRTLENADDLDIIFEKHIEDRTGKYIVFCSSVEHLYRMVELVPEWFSRVDKNPHIYCAYSDNPETDTAFDSFKKDTSDNLKLLFCVDMLNEGVHVDDISGVILLRPTVSPIIYKQQIGRALSASSRLEPIIFDIVLNIENLYSIGAIEDEMQIALAYYRNHGMDREIVNEHFRIIDEVKDCRELFKRLNDALTFSWNSMYDYARKYFEEYGNLEVPKRYRSSDGVSLGMWIDTQRRVYSGKVSGNLSDTQIEKLDKIGMRWDSYKDSAWEKNLSAARSYYQEYGNLLIKSTESYKGINLGSWLSNLRIRRKSCVDDEFLSEERIKSLDEIGMIWDVPDYVWEQSYNAALSYYKSHGDLNAPAYYVAENGIALGVWLNNMRSRRRANTLSEDRIKRLDEIGMLWKSKYSLEWEKSFEAAKCYKMKYGSIDISVDYVTEDGCPLGRWIRRQRDNYSKLSKSKIERLNELGIIRKSDPWEEKYKLLQDYYKVNGNLNIAVDYVVNGVWLGRWLYEQIARLNNRSSSKKQLTDEQEKKLEALGIVKNTLDDEELWLRCYDEVRQFLDEDGKLNIPKEYVGSSEIKLSAWLARQRRKLRNNELTAKQAELMKDLGIEKNTDPWQIGYIHARQYYKEHKSLLVEHSYCSNDGFKLGVWIANQRSRKKNNQLKAEQISLLNDIDMVWDQNEYKWTQSYKELKNYKEKYGNTKIPKGYMGASGNDIYFWLQEQKKKYTNGKLEKDRLSLLVELGAIEKDYLK